ncbi:hypothetical protein [Catellatospora vulcania]|uniref:hypothetical protein n=1 Tax=Catellatospora vulcania TaxID=1460450 RepID=UPI0012D3D506|nr:hypothetical protein [Catellatospora vulcania]
MTACPRRGSSITSEFVVRLTDDAVSGKAVNVASVHLATSDNEDADCAWER